VKENLNSLSFFDEKHGIIVGSSGITLYTDDGGKSWRDQESSTRFNLFAVQAFGRASAVAAGELGIVLLTDDGGKTWAVQPGITGKVLQAIAYRGGDRVWVAGKGGTMLKRTQRLSSKAVSLPKGPPVLKTAAPRARPQPRVPLVEITDDGDIPSAVPKPEP